MPAEITDYYGFYPLACSILHKNCLKRLINGKRVGYEIKMLHEQGWENLYSNTLQCYPCFSKSKNSEVTAFVTFSRQLFSTQGTAA